MDSAMTVIRDGGASPTVVGNTLYGSIYSVPSFWNDGYWLNGVWIPYSSGGYPVVQYWPMLQAFCAGDVHVFGCEHAETCKCGAASRRVEPKRCGSCGKKL